MWVDVHGLVWRSDRRIWRRPWSWHVWCRTADGQQHHRAGRAWSHREAKRQELLAWGELFLQFNSHTAMSTRETREVALPIEALNALTALQQWRYGRISGLDLIDIYDQAEAAIRNLLPVPDGSVARTLTEQISTTLADARGAIDRYPSDGSRPGRRDQGRRDHTTTGKAGKH